MRARLPISASRLSSPLAPPPTPITAIRPPVASASRLAGRLGAPTSSSTTSNGPCSTKSSGATASAPSAATSSRSSSRRTVAVTRAPAARPSWIAAVPTPPAPPCTSRRSPGREPAWVKSASCAVVKTSGKPPAAGQSSASGTGIATRSWTDGELGLAAAADDRHHAVALGEALGARAAGRDLAGELEARGCRAARRAAPGSALAPLEHVGAVEAGAADAHEQLAGAGLGVGMLLDEDLAVADGRGAHQAGDSSARLVAEGGRQVRCDGPGATFPWKYQRALPAAPSAGPAR